MGLLLRKEVHRCMGFLLKHGPRLLIVSEPHIESSWIRLVYVAKTSETFGRCPPGYESLYFSILLNQIRCDPAFSLLPFEPFKCGGYLAEARKATERVEMLVYPKFPLYTPLWLSQALFRVPE